MCVESCQMPAKVLGIILTPKLVTEFHGILTHLHHLAFDSLSDQDPWPYHGQSLTPKVILAPRCCSSSKDFFCASS